MYRHSSFHTPKIDGAEGCRTEDRKDSGALGQVGDAHRVFLFSSETDEISWEALDSKFLNPCKPLFLSVME